MALRGGHHHKHKTLEEDADGTLILEGYYHLRAHFPDYDPECLCALSPAQSPVYLAYPLPQPSTQSPYTPPPAHVPPTSQGHQNQTQNPPGHVLIFDAVDLEPLTVIEAHLSPLSYITFDSSGTKLATASDKGTIIRVFSVPEGRKLAQFRRGSMPTRIFSMAFNATGTLLAVGSASETVHVFKVSDGEGSSTDKSGSAPGSPTSGRHSRIRSSSSLGATSDVDDEQLAASGAYDQPDADISGRDAAGGFAGYLRRTSQTAAKSFAGLAAGYLPTSVNQMLEPARDFAWFKVPRAPAGPGIASGDVSRGGAQGAMKSIVAMSRNAPEVMVVTSDGQFLVFGIDLEKGGEGVLKEAKWVVDSHP
ncbi:MAG: hypothetical protein Q9162_000164 [Coniocarpon cinnabarinum]